MIQFRYTSMLSFSILITVLVAGCALPLTEVTPTASFCPIPTIEPTPTSLPARFEAAECQFEALPGKDIECGYLSVPEDRSNPHSTTIRLHVAIVKSKNPQPLPDPLVYLQGGPGAKAVDSVPWLIDLFGKILADRDLIVFDQRGTGYSQPSLDCPELADQMYAMLAQNLTPEQENELFNQAALACQEHLGKEGVNLAAYNTAANAADVDDLRRALGYEQWNLYGGSYGTHLALNILRDFPSGVRSAVLDSVCLPQADHYAEIAASGERALNLLFERCAADDKCNAAYPHLATVFFDLVAELDANPVSLEITRFATGEMYPIILNGSRLINAFFSLLYYADQVEVLPDLIYNLQAGKWERLESPLSWNQAIYDDLSEAMWISLNCADEAVFSSAETIQAANASVDPRLSAALSFYPSLDLCAQWNTKATPAIENQAVVSNVPALILSGDYDPIHPPDWARQAAETLSAAQLYEFPNGAHGVISGGGAPGWWCSSKLLVDFVNNPTLPLEASCVSKMKATFKTR